MDCKNSGRRLGGMECQEAIDWVGEDGADGEVGMLEALPQGRFNSFGETAYDIQALFFASGTLPQWLQWVKIPGMEGVPNHAAEVVVVRMFCGYRSQRCKEAVGIGLVVYGIHQLCVGKVDGVVKQLAFLLGHDVGQVIIKQYSSHMVGRPLVAKYIAGACELAIDACAVIMAGVAACP